MNNKVVAKVRLIVVGIIMSCIGLKNIYDSPKGYGVKETCVAVLCLGIFVTIFGIFNKPIESMWSTKRIKGNIISWIIISVFIWLLLPNILGDIYIYLKGVIDIVKEIIIYAVGFGTICDLIHLVINNKK